MVSKTVIPKTIEKLSKRTNRLTLIDKLIVPCIFILLAIAWFIMFYSLFFVIEQFNKPKQERVPAVAPVIPGVTIPFVAIFPLVLIVAIHEFGHGLFIARYGGKIKEVGLVYLLFIPIAAYVDYEEEDLEKMNHWQRINIYGAGSLFNMISFLLVTLIIIIYAHIFGPIEVNYFTISLPSFTWWFLLLSFCLGVANMLPIPALDGQKVLEELKNKFPKAKNIILIMENILLIIFLYVVIISIYFMI